MYNRYIRQDDGTYSRIPEEESPSSSQQESTAKETASDSSPPPFTNPPDGLSGFLQHILDQLHLDHVDTGDLLLLGLLFFLFREHADEELLVALGLLLIL